MASKSSESAAPQLRISRSRVSLGKKSNKVLSKADIYGLEDEYGVTDQHMEDMLRSLSIPCHPEHMWKKAKNSPTADQARTDPVSDYEDDIVGKGLEKFDIETSESTPKQRTRPWYTAS